MEQSEVKLWSLRHRPEGRLAPHIDAFAVCVREQGFKRPSIAPQLRLIAKLSRWMKSQAVGLDLLVSTSFSDHAAFRAVVQRRAAARSGGVGGALPARMDPVARGREQRRDRLGAHAVPDARSYLAAYYVGREGQTKPGQSLSPGQLWWQHTAGAAQALGLDGVVGKKDTQTDKKTAALRELVKEL